MPLKDIVKRKEYAQKYCKNNREKILEQKREIHKKFPWIRSYRAAKARCNNRNAHNYKYSGGKGIKFLLTQEEIKRLW